MFSLLKDKRTVPGLTGIEMGADGVAVVRVVREPGRTPRVTLCDYRPWEAATKKQVLARLASDHDLKRSRCATLLDPSEYSLLLTEAPEVPAEELRSAIRWRIKDLIDFHVGDATLDIFDVGAAAAVSGKARSMYVVAARNAAIQGRVDLCDDAGIHLDVIDIPEMAQRNLASVLAEDVRGVVMLSLAPARGLITITRQAEIYLSRVVELGLDTLTTADDRASYFDQLVLEIQRSLDYYDSHFREAHIEHLALSPACGDVPGLVEYLNQNLNLKASVMNLGQALQCDRAQTEMLTTHALTALGAALRQEEKVL